ncbi:MFS transporter [Nocardia farcinica]
MPDGTGLRPAPTRTAQATVLAAATLTIMAAAIIAPSLPAMADAYADTPGAETLVQLALTVTSLAIAVGAPAAGMAADRLGRRPVLLTGLVLYAAAGTASLYVTDLSLLLATRALLGIAVAAIMTVITTLIADWFTGPRRARMLGLQQAFASIGGVVFLPLAGVLAGLDYRAPAWIHALSLAVVPFALSAVPEPIRRDTDPARRAGFRVPGRVLVVYALALTLTLVFFLAPTQLPFLLPDFGAGPAVTGAVIAVSTLTGAVGAFAYAAVRRRVGSTTITCASVALLATGWLVIGTAGTLWAVVAGLLIGGTGVGLAVPNLNLILTEVTPPDARARALSGLVTAIFLGQFASPLIAAPLIEVSGIAGTFTWTAIACLAFLAAATSFLVRTPHRKEEDR